MTPTQSKLSDQGMVRIMGMVLAALLGLLVFIFLVARVLGGAADVSESRDSLLEDAQAQRLASIGKVRTADEVAAQEVAVASAAGPVKTGEELVTGGACAGCHAAGVAGAPKLGDDTAWAERREQGYDTLVSAVINGLNAMPARGGSTYTDDEIKRAVKYIAMFPDSEVPADVGTEDTAAAPADGAAATADAPGGDAAPASAPAADQAGGQAGGQAEAAKAAGDAAAPAAEGGSAGEAN